VKYHQPPSEQWNGIKIIKRNSRETDRVPERARKEAATITTDAASCRLGRKRERDKGLGENNRNWTARIGDKR
jgi:hypothetical protein